MTMSGKSQHPSFTLAESDEAYFVHIPAQFLKLIKLLHYEKMNYAEIAAQAGLPVGTVKSRIFRGREIIYRLRSEDDARGATRQQPTMGLLHA